MRILKRVVVPAAIMKSMSAHGCARYILVVDLVQTDCAHVVVVFFRARIRSFLRSIVTGIAAIDVAGHVHTMSWRVKM